MTENYSNDDYKNSYAELLILFDHMPEYVIKKIPNNIIDFYRENARLNSNFVYDEVLPIQCQDISHLTEIIYSNLYLEYLATNNEKKRIKNKDNEELKKIEDEKRKKYNPDDLFKNDKRDEEKVEISSSLNQAESESLSTDDKNIIKRIIMKIKTIFYLHNK